jgi:molecular chaperone HtpG
MSERQRFNLHLPGLLKVLAEHLYSSKKVGVRELIQNSHDSCIRRRVEGNEPDYEPRIDLSIDLRRRVLIIADNGFGLTADEITNYLATIGRGYTRELRERLSMSDSAEAGELIGQFGLGFLSAFLLASDVTLLTRSYQGGPCYKWQSSGDEYYAMEPAWREEIGTTVELRLKPASAFLLQEKALIETVRQYADFLPIPIHVENEELPVNLLAPPWEADYPEQAIKDYITRSFRSEALWVMPLRDRQVNLGHDTLTVPMKGFLFVPPGSVASVREFGDLTVYIRRMFICERERDLLPPWARFVRGIIDSPLLQPTASRESIHQDENFELVRQSVEQQLGEGLRELAADEPMTWKRIVRGHADVIIGWAVNDNEFFERVEDIVTFRTSRGPLSLREYLDASGGTLYYVTRELGSLQEQMLAEGRDVPAIDASWFAVTPFLEKYASRHAEVSLVQLDGEADQLLRPVAGEPFKRLLDWYRDQDIRARVATFKPAEAPALILYPQGAEIAREAEASREAGDLPGPLAGLIQEYVDQRFSGEGDLRGTLYLNAGCPLVKRLAERPPQGEALGFVLTLLHQIARLFAGRMLSAADAVQAFSGTTQAIEGLLRR